MEFGGEDFAGGGDLERAEKLQSFGGRAVALHTLRDAEEFQLRAERRIELAGAEGAGMGGAGDEFPEGTELGEFGLRRIVVVRRGVVDVCSDEEDIANLAVANEFQEVRNLQLPPERRAVIAIGDRFVVFFVGHISPSGMSLAMTFQVAVEARSCCLSHDI